MNKIKTDELMRAVQMRDVCKIKSLLADERVDPAAYDHWAVRHACSMGYADVAEALFAPGRVHPGVQNNIALLHAVGQGRANIVRMLLADERVDPNGHVRSLGLDYIIRHRTPGYLEVVRAIADDDRVYIEFNAMLAAVETRDLDAWSLLIAHPRAPVSARNNRLLERALALGFQDVVDILIGSGRVIGLRRKLDELIGRGILDEEGPYALWYLAGCGIPMDAREFTLVG